VGHVEQVKNEWSSKTWTSLFISETGICPDSHPEDFVFNVYRGAVTGCDCIDRDLKFFRGIKCSKGKNGKHKGEDCYES
jgi:hypothetical protein